MLFGRARRFSWPVANLAQSGFVSSLVFGRGLGGIFFAKDICCRRFWVRLLPMSLGDRERIDFEFLPPGNFITSLVQLPMMTAAERHRELVADFETERSRLRKPQMMRVGRLPAADDAWRPIRPCRRTGLHPVPKTPS
jgi:hypothetical protein